MTAPALLDLAELAAHADVPVDRLRRYAEVGLLPPARRDGDRYGYPPSEAGAVRLLASVEQLGITGDDLTGLATAWRGDDCAETRQRLTEAVTVRLTAVEHDLAEQIRQAAEYGPGTTGWADVLSRNVTVTGHAARLQAVAAELATTAHPGPCGDTCWCMTALTAPSGAYHFPANSPDAMGGQSLECDLAADDGDARDRITGWQQVLARVLRRDPLGDAEAGLVLRFPLDADLAAALARLAAAEYRCCAFGSYTVVIDETGLRLEVRLPAEAAGHLAAVLGVPDVPAATPKEPASAAHQS